MIEDWEYCYKAKVLAVTDGDTCLLELDLGFRLTYVIQVRLLGINTPETFGVKKDSEEYAKGMLSKTALKEWIEGKEVTVVTTKWKKEKYGRYLAVIYLDGVDINKKMITEKLATEYVL
jgi:micrococcal nuclease